MKKALFYFGILLVVILADCSLDNKTAKDATDTLIDAIVENDSDTLDALTDLNKDDQKSLDQYIRNTNLPIKIKRLVPHKDLKNIHIPYFATIIKVTTIPCSWKFI